MQIHYLKQQRLLTPIFGVLAAYLLLVFVPLVQKVTSGHQNSFFTISSENASLETLSRLAFSGLVEKDAAGVLVAAKGEATAVSTGAENAAQGNRLNLQLSAEQAAGARAPTSIQSYSDHALKQIASRDGGIGVNPTALKNAFKNPIKIEYVPSQYGPTFRYTGKDAVVVVNAEGKVVTTWGTGSMGVKK